MPTRLIVELVAALGAALTIWVLWEHHDSVEQKLGEQRILTSTKASADAQKKIDDKVIADAESKHAKEIKDIKDNYDNQSIQPVVVCYTKLSGSVPKTEVRPDQSGSAISSGPSADVSGESTQVADIGPALKLLAKRLDTLNADARQLNSEVAETK